MKCTQAQFSGEQLFPLRDPRNFSVPCIAAKQDLHSLLHSGLDPHYHWSGLDSYVIAFHLRRSGTMGAVDHTLVCLISTS